MTDHEYEIWWQLHLRVATGETLATEEEQIYLAGLAFLEREETAQPSRADANLLRSLRGRIQTLMQLQDKLQLQSARLDEKIEELERTYRQMTGLDLSVDY